MRSSIKTNRIAAALIAATFVLLMMAMIQLANPAVGLAEMARANRRATAIAEQPHATKRSATKSPKATEAAQSTVVPATSVSAATDEPDPTHVSPPTAAPPTSAP